MIIPDRVRDYLGGDLEIQDTDFGYIVCKPLYRPSKGVKNISVGGHALNIGDGIVAVDEHVLLLMESLPIGGYPTTSEEIVGNIGDSDIIL